jgi:hypothetical protein
MKSNNGDKSRFYLKNALVVYPVTCQVYNGSMAMNMKHPVAYISLDS